MDLAIFIFLLGTVLPGDPSPTIDDFKIYAGAKFALKIRL
jgi:hypothetical protein